MSELIYTFKKENYDNIMNTIILPLGSIAPFIKARNETGKYPDVIVISPTGDKRVFVYNSEIFGSGFYYTDGNLRLKLNWI